MYKSRLVAYIIVRMLMTILFFAIVLVTSRNMLLSAISVIIFINYSKTISDKVFLYKYEKRKLIINQTKLAQH